MTFIKPFRLFAAKNCLLGIYFSFLASSVAAQSPGTEEPSEHETAPIRAIAVGYENDLEQLHILNRSSETGMFESVGMLNLRLFSYSRAFSCPIVEGRLFFGVENGVDVDGITQYRPVASVAWAPQYKQIALVFIPNSYRGRASGNDAYTISRMDMSTSSFALGSIKAINLSPAVSYIMIGEHKETVQPKQVVNISEVKDVLAANMVSLRVAYQAKEEIRMIKQTRIRYLKRLRYLIILYPDIENRRIGLAFVSDSGRLFENE